MFKGSLQKGREGRKDNGRRERNEYKFQNERKNIKVLWSKRDGIIKIQ